MVDGQPGGASPTHGDAVLYGSISGHNLNAPVVGMT
jgi:hypothetical protein